MVDDHKTVVVEDGSMLSARSDTELVESTADATADDVDIDSVTLAARCQQVASQRPSATLVSHRRTTAMPPRRYAAQRHIATRLYHNFLADARNSCMSRLLTEWTIIVATV